MHLLNCETKKTASEKAVFKEQYFLVKLRHFLFNFNAHPKHKIGSGLREVHGSIIHKAVVYIFLVENIIEQEFKIDFRLFKIQSIFCIKIGQEIIFQLQIFIIRVIQKLLSNVLVLNA